MTVFYPNMCYKETALYLYVLGLYCKFTTSPRLNVGLHLWGIGSACGELAKKIWLKKMRLSTDEVNHNVLPSSLKTYEKQSRPLDKSV